MATIRKEKDVKALQTETGELEIEKSKLMEKIAEINLKQQQINTQIYQMVLDTYKSQAFTQGNLVVPGGELPKLF
jgi:predicted  nucleic acid-binding Zn-ribbon protein